MGCIPANVISSIDPSCGYDKGGITRVWVSLLEGNGVDVFGWVDGYTGYSFVEDGATDTRHLDMDSIALTPEAAAALGSDATTFAEIGINKNGTSSSFTESMEATNGYGLFDISIECEIPNMNIKSNPTVAKMSNPRYEYVAIIETRARDSEFRSTYHFVGRDGGLSFEKVTGETGSEKSSKNRYLMTLKGLEPELSYIVKTDSSFSYGLLPAPIAIIDPNSDISTSVLVSADFVADKTSVFEGDKVSFTDLSTASPNSWNWNFGDGNTSTTQNGANTYASAGSYDVSLAASNDYTIDTEIKASYINVAAKNFVQIGTWSQPSVNSLASINSSPLQRIELDLDGGSIYGNDGVAQNLVANFSDSSGSGDAFLWAPNPSNLTIFTSVGDCITVDLDAVASTYTGLQSIYSDYATGSISCLNNIGGALVVDTDFDGAIDFDLWDSSVSYGNLSFRNGAFTSTLPSWAGDIPTLFSLEIRPDVLMNQADVDVLLVKLSEANWSTQLGKNVKILGSSEPPSAGGAGAIALLNSLGVTVTTN